MTAPHSCQKAAPKFSHDTIFAKTRIGIHNEHGERGRAASQKDLRSNGALGRTEEMNQMMSIDERRRARNPFGKHGKEHDIFSFSSLLAINHTTFFR